MPMKKAAAAPKKKVAAAPKKRATAAPLKTSAMKRAASGGEPPAKRAKGETGAARPAKGGRKVDSKCPQSGVKVHGDYACTLNQTNVGANNNKFYIIQVLEGGGKFYAWNRWGRVGDVGQNKLLPCSTADQAIKEFCSKFRAKTTNAWDNRGSFKAVKGKYTLVETDDAGGAGDDAPMGKLTQAQIGKGQKVLDQLEVAIKKKKHDQVTEFSSQFFSLVPTNFGWKKPVPINTMPMLSEKQELLKFFLRMGFEQVESNKSVTPIDGIMDLPVPKSLDEASSGICGKGPVISSNDQGRQLHGKKAGKPTTGMTDAMYAAIMLYTSNAIYQDLNKALRDSDRVKIKKYFKYLRLLLAAMDHLPQQRRTLWRGLSVDLSKDAQYVPGQSVTWWGVSSCTSNMGVAKGFAASCGGGATVVTVHSKSACNISAISFFGNEEESLLRPGTVMKVKSRSQKGGMTEITLEETGQAIK